MSRSITLDQFIRESMKAHGSHYDYSHTKLSTITSPVEVLCPVHGAFITTPRYHMKGMGKCPSCAGKVTPEIFIKKARELNGSRYLYDKVSFRSTTDAVIITCREHGDFVQIVRNHLDGAQCPVCSGKARHTTASFVEKAKRIHGNKYDYSKVAYVRAFDPVEIVCPMHGSFWQRAHDHYYNGCPKCAYEEKAGKRCLTFDEMLCKARKVHGSKYQYVQDSYSMMHAKMSIICPEHGIFEQHVHNHIYLGNGCPQCHVIQSQDEQELLEFIKVLVGSSNVVSPDRSIIQPYELDIYVPEHKLAFEYNGLYYHSEEIRGKNYHKDKTERCDQVGTHLIQVYEDDWIYKKDIVKSRIQHLFGKTSEKLFARNCIIQQVSPSECTDFLEENHIQGSCGAKIRYGLYHEDILVSIMTLGNNRINLGGHASVGSWELLRFCNRLNTTVIGGAQKLFKHFIKNNYCRQVLSYADRSWTVFKGSVYEKLGFSLEGVTPPNYHYFKGNKRYNRFTFRKDRLIAQGYDPSLTEREIMSSQKYRRIYDSGSYHCMFNFNH